ncbi:MAG: hypothetical protein IT158_20205 [Bryobacterales bacterium]|nr:hypothetical protein [Bryobacterales bacterium]
MRGKENHTSITNFFHPVLNALTDGNIIRDLVAWALRILGLLVLAGGLIAVFAVLRFALPFAGEGPEGMATVAGGLLLAVILLVAVIAITQIHFYRAAGIASLRHSAYTVLPIISILFRAAGEIYATLGLAVGIGGCVFVWLAGFNPLRMLGGLGTLLPAVRTEASFIGGLFFLIYLAVSSFTFLVISYFLAEGTLVLVDIARNVRIMAGGSEKGPVRDQRE